MKTSKGIPFTFENTPFRVRRLWWRARRKSAGLARYFKPLQQRHSAKDACYTWGILERERYIRSSWVICFAIVLPGLAMAEEVIVSIGDRDITDTQLEQVVYSSPGGVEFPALDETQQAGTRGNFLKRLIAAELMYLEAVSLGKEKSPEFISGMEKYRKSRLYQSYLQTLRHSMAIPDDIVEKINQQFKGNSDAIAAAKSIYAGKRFPSLKEQRLKELKEKYNVKIHAEELDESCPKNDVLLAEGDGVKVNFLDIRGQNCPNRTESLLRLQRAVEAQVFAHAAEDEKVDIKPQLSEYRRTLLSRMLMEEKESEWAGSEEEKRKYLEKHKEIGHAPANWHIGQIVVDSREQAESLREEILKGASLFNLAEEHSIDAYGREHAGDMGWVKESTGHPDLEAAAKKLKDDEISEVIETPKGFHLLTVIDRRPGREIPYETIKDRVLRNMIRDKLSHYLFELQKKYPLEWKVPVKGSTEESFFVGM